jgi:large subunit ribosomal protein L7/L12
VTQEEIIDSIKKMNAVELSDLAKGLQEAFGIEGGIPMAFAGPMAGGATQAAAAVEEEQTEFSVVLTAVGDSRVPVIKAVKEITGLTLSQAKELVDKAPVAIKEKVSQQEAEDLRAKLEEVHATVEIK